METLLNTNITNEARGTSVLEFVYSLVLVIFFSSITGIIYNKYGKSISNRKIFSSFFIMFSVSIFLIFSIIKSSIVLSLGLVGALSVVRFRNAIKDTEQIMYLLLLISISISLAANQYLFVTISLVSLIIIILIKDLLTKEAENNHFINIKLENAKKLDEMFSLLKNHSSYKITGLEYLGEIYHVNIIILSLSEINLTQVTNELKDISLSFRISELE
jgi:hypothetical protein